MDLRRDQPLTEQTRRWLDHAVFLCLLLTFAVAPHSIKSAARICTVGTLLFFVSLLVTRSRFIWHSLFRPVLVFLLLAAISTAFSSAPDWSWRRLAWFSLMLAVIVAARTITTRTRITALIAILLLSSSAILVRVGWQYTHGIGVRISGLTPNALFARGLQPTDVIQTLNGRSTRSPSQFLEVLKTLPADQNIALGIARGAPIERVTITLSRTELNSSLAERSIELKRGHPLRAQAGFYHYVPFAGFMCIIALLAWGLALTAPQNTLRLLIFILCLAATGAVFATVTRTYLAALLLGGFVAFWIVSRRIMRIVALASAVTLLVLVTAYVQRERGLGWIATGDAGTQYRVEMWRDGLQLVRQHPLFGIGLDAAFSGKWDIPAYRRFPLMSHFHSTPIQLAVDTGLPTLLAWLWIAVALFRTLFRAQRRLPREERVLRGVILGALGSAVAFYAASLVHYNLGDGEVMILMSVLMGVVVAIDGIAARARTTHRTDVALTMPAPPPVGKAV